MFDDPALWLPFVFAALMGLAILIYVILDGFDLGIGILVILTPPQYTGRVAGVFVANGNGDRVEQGLFGGVHNGGREHFRFTRPGGAYGNDLFAVADLKDGATVSWHIPVGARRTQY